MDVNYKLQICNWILNIIQTWMPIEEETHHWDERLKLVMWNMIETKINNPNMYLLIHDLIASFSAYQLTKIALEQSMHLAKVGNNNLSI